MEIIYTLHQGNIWGCKEVSEEKIFEAIGLKDGSKFLFKEAFNLQKEFQKKAERYIKKRFPFKKARTDLVIYHVVHRKGNPSEKYQAFCDINLYDEPKSNPPLELKEGFSLPKKIKEVFKRYQVELHKIIERQARKSRVVKDINQTSLMCLEGNLKKLVNQNYSLLTKILLKDKNKNKRADAAWLLSWTDNGSAPGFLFKAFKDRSHGVHNNAAHSLLQIAKIKKIKLKIRAIYNLLRHHSTICRNKGAFLLLEALKQKKETSIPKDIENILLKMRSCRQPNNREPAIMLAKLLKLKREKRL